MKRFLDELQALEQELERDPRGFTRRLLVDLAIVALPLAVLIASIVAVVGWIAFTLFVQQRVAHPQLRLAFAVTFVLVGVLFRMRRPSRPPLTGIRVITRKAPAISEVLARAGARRWLSAVVVTEPALPTALPPRTAFNLGATDLAISLPLALTIDATDLAILVEYEARVRMRRETHLLFWAERLLLAYSSLRDVRPAGWTISRLARWASRAGRVRLHAEILALHGRREVARTMSSRIGAPALVGAFARARAAERWLLHDFYRHLDLQHRRNQSPPHGLFRTLARHAASREVGNRRWIDEAFDIADDPTVLRDSLATMAKRMDVSRSEIADRGSYDTCAAHEWLRPFDAIIDAASALWADAHRALWALSYDRVQVMTEICERLERRADDISPDDERLRIRLVLATRDAAQALPLARAAFDRNPRDTRLEALLAVCLLETGDDRGLAHAERAVDIAPESIRVVAYPAYVFCSKHRRIAASQRWRARAAQREWDEALAGRERVTVDRDTVFEPHGFAPAELLGVARVLAGAPDVHDAYLVKRRVEFLRDEPSWLLVVVTRPRLFGSGEHVHARTAQSIEARLRDLDRDIVVLSVPSVPRWLETKLRNVTHGSLPIENARAARAGRTTWPVRADDIATFLAPRSPTRPVVRTSFTVLAIGAVGLTALFVSRTESLRVFAPQRVAVIHERVVDMDHTQFDPRIVRGRIRRVRALRGLPPGTACEVETFPAPPDAHTFNCRVVVRCNDNHRTLYDGFTQCAVTNGRVVRALDPFGNAVDGDPMVEFDDAAHRAVVDDGAATVRGRLVVIELDASATNATP